MTSTYRLHAINELHLYNNVLLSTAFKAVVDKEALGVDNTSDSKASKGIYIQEVTERETLDNHPRQQRK